MENQQNPGEPSIRPEEIPNVADRWTEREMNALRTQALSAESQSNEHNRNEKLRNVIAWAAAYRRICSHGDRTFDSRVALFGT